MHAVPNLLGIGRARTSMKGGADNPYRIAYYIQLIWYRPVLLTLELFPHFTIIEGTDESFVTWSVMLPTRMRSSFPRPRFPITIQSHFLSIEN
jgi:hypothetical protein